MQEFKVRAVLGETAKVVLRNFRPFGAVAVVVFGVFAAFERMIGSHVFTTALHGDHVLPSRGMIVLAFAVGFLLELILAAMIIHGTYQDMGGRKATLDVCIQGAIANLRPIVGVWALMLTIFLVLAFPLWAGSVTLIAFLSAGFPRGVTLTISFLAIGIPLVMAMVAMCVMVPAVVVERPGAWGSVRRSLALTRGNRWSIFAVLTILSAVDWGIETAVNYFASATGMTASAIPGVLCHSVSFALTAVAVAVIYFHLRRVKEGTAIGQIPAQFGRTVM